MIKLSVITPTLNRNYIKEAWQSLEKQTCKDFEWIIVDNGSNKKHLDLLEEIKSKASFQVIVLSEQQRGAAAARKKGENFASGKYISYLDDDDLYSPDLIEAWIADFEQNNSDVSVMHDCKLFFDVMFTRIYINNGNFNSQQCIADEFSRFKLPFTHSFVRFAYTKEISLRSGSWDCSLTSREDIAYLFSIILLNPKITAAKAGTYLIRRENIVKYETRKSFESVLQSFKMILDKTKDHKYAEYAKKTIGADIAKRWEKVSILYPDIADEYANFAKSLGYNCNTPMFKRRILRWIKTPFRRIALLGELYCVVVSKIKKLIRH